MLQEDRRQPARRRVGRGEMQRGRATVGLDAVDLGAVLQEQADHRLTAAQSRQVQGCHLPSVAAHCRGTPFEKKLRRSRLAREACVV